jgi:hypothetical protein
MSDQEREPEEMSTRELEAEVVRLRAALAAREEPPTEQKLREALLELTAAFVERKPATQDRRHAAIAAADALLFPRKETTLPRDIDCPDSGAAAVRYRAEAAREDTERPEEPNPIPCPVCGSPMAEAKVQRIARRRTGTRATKVEPGQRAYLCENGHWHDGERETGPVPEDITITESGW